MLSWLQINNIKETQWHAQSCKYTTVACCWNVMNQEKNLLVLWDLLKMARAIHFYLGQSDIAESLYPLITVSI